MWSILGLDTLLLNFYGFTLIHLIDPLSQVVQTVNMWYAIYIYKLFLFVHIYKGKRQGDYPILFCFSLVLRRDCTNELFRAHSFGCWKERVNWTRDFSLSRIEGIFERQTNIGMTFYGINQIYFTVCFNVFHEILVMV